MAARLRSWSVPFALLLLCLLSFGLLIPALGFYWDDWPSLLIHRLQGPEGFRQFFALDRPTTYISYVLLMPVFGTEPVLWQLFTLLLRWVCAVLVWQFARQMWPAGETVAVWSALLFAIHPVFRQQAIALTYHQLWMEYVFFLGSLVAMVLAVRQPHRRMLWTAAALAGMALNLLISEYFLGLELLRPLILWLALHSERAPRQRIRTAVLRYLPFLALLLAYLAWRFVFLDLPGEDRNAPTMLTDLLANPAAGLLQFARMLLQDASHILAAAWYPVFGPGVFTLQGRFELLAVGLSLGVGLLTAAYLWSRPGAPLEANPQAVSAGQALLLGLVMIAIGPLPGWVTERQVTVGAWSDRLAVPAMMGAALALAGGIAWLTRSRVRGLLVISLLVGLAAGNHVRNANDYRWARIQQNRFFWQFYWRAPSVQPETAVFARAEVVPKTGLYSTAMGLNLIYAQSGQENRLPYWFFSLSRDFAQRAGELAAGTTIEETFRQWSFTGSSRAGLIVYYEPSEADCLRFLTPTDGGDPALSPLEVTALPVIQLDRIGVDAVPPPDRSIFGPEPAHDWCYLFQKADLARQQQDWAAVAQLGDEAQARGFDLQNAQSNTPQEWVPFVQGYARTGQFDKAVQRTRQIIEREPEMAAWMCGTWDTLRSEAAGAQAHPEVQQLWADLHCGQ